MTGQGKTIQRGPKKRQQAAAESTQPKKRGRPAKLKIVPQLVEGLTAGREVEHVALTEINLADETFKFRVNLRVKDLVESITQNGQQLPVILRRRDGHVELQVISGFRRLTAIHAIGWPSAHAIVLEDVSDEEAFRLSILENEKRKTYSDLDRAYAITKYRQMGLKVADIASDLFGLSKKQVERLQALTELPDFMQQAIADDRLPTTQALVLKQLHDKYGVAQVNLVHWTEKATAESLSVRSLRAAIVESLPAKLPVPSLYSSTTDKKSGSAILRLKAVRLDLGQLTSEQRAMLAQELDALLHHVRAQ